MLSALLLAVATQAQHPILAANTTASPPPVAMAVRAGQPPVIDGRDNEDLWRTAEPITALRQWQPTEDAPARYRTEARVAYDEHNLYVFVRAYDPHPDSILKLLARRDTWTAADKIWVMIDSYHDRRSGFEFGVNPAGVKFDMAISNDGNEDDAWDAVWDVATTVDSLGWTAEYKIPLSQLRYSAADSNVFGFSVWRDLQRYSERESWPVLRRSRPGFTSQFGELHGLTGLGAPRRLEVAPYIVAKNSPQQTASGYDRDQSFAIGADIKYGITPNLRLSATVNPDFGQVEADPSVLNLSAFETYFSERRPFFVEGAGLFSFSVNCNVVNCSGENLFYSRRIGRAPQLDQYADVGSATSTRILGAGKLTGRVGSFNVAMVDAVTQRVSGRADTTMEPATNYFATRLQKDWHRGEDGIGAMFTAVNRDLDPASSPYLRRQAYVGALDFRRRMFSGHYELSGSFDVSYVAGSAQSIAATQLSSVHFYQRPEGGQTFDSTRTSLSGASQEIQFGKIGGKYWRWQSSYQRHTAGFDVNDLGFLQRADQQTWATWTQLRTAKPTWITRQLTANFNYWQFWTTSGMPTERAVNTNIHVQLKNSMWVHFGGTIGQLGTTYCDFDCTRGGPSVRQSAYIAPWFGWEGDGRNVISPNLFVNLFYGDGGRSWSRNINGNVNLRIASRFSPSFGFSFTRRVNDLQPKGAIDFAGTTHYVFAHLLQTTASLSARLDYTMTRTLSLQVYAAPFVTKGTYSNARELTATPRAADRAARYQPYADATYDPLGFNFKAFNSNVVLRWEYRPGSTLFVVWQQGRSDFTSAEGTRTATQNLGDLFDLRPANTFLIKMSYWLNR